MIRTLRILRWAGLGLLAVMVVTVAILEIRPRAAPLEDAPAGLASVPAGISIGGPFHLIVTRATPSPMLIIGVVGCWCSSATPIAPTNVR